MNLLASTIIPIIIALIIFVGIYKKIDVFNVFINGVEENIKIGIGILPSLIALMVAIGVFKSSGLLDAITLFVKPITNILHMPVCIIPQALLRPISNSGSLVIFKDILEKFGPDSFIGRVSSIMQGSSETTLYVITIYFGVININKIKYTLPCALIADLVCVILSVLVAYLLF